MEKELQLLRRAKTLAREYRRLTGRPLGITGEVGEYEAARLLKLKLGEVRTAGHDATRRRNGKRERIQIKTRCLPAGSKPGQRIGRIDITKPCDLVMLVLLDEDFEATEIYEAKWRAVRRALTAPGSKSRNVRGALGVSKFKSIGTRVWPTHRA